MKNIIYIIFSLVLLFSACSVEDFEDANPPAQLNAPAGFVREVTSADGYLAYDAEEETYFNYVKAGSTVSFVLDIVSANGMIGEASVSLSNIIQRDPLGAATVSLEGSQGQQNGALVVSYTAGAILGREEMTVTVKDQQDPPKQTSFTISPFLTVDAGVCFPTSRDIDEKLYRSRTTNVTDAEGGPAIDRIISVVAFQVNSDIGADQPGMMEISDGSFGLYTVQGYNPLTEAVITICDDNIVSGTGDLATFSGTVNADGTLDIAWTTVFGDAGTTELTPCPECSLDWSPSTYYQ